MKSLLQKATVVGSLQLPPAAVYLFFGVCGGVSCLVRVPGSVSGAKVAACLLAGLAPTDSGATEPPAVCSWIILRRKIDQEYAINQSTAGATYAAGDMYSLLFCAHGQPP